MNRVYIVLIISALFNINNKLNAQTPYNTSWEKDGIITGLTMANLTLSFILYNNVESLSQIEIQSADRTKLNWFDRSTAYNWSLNAARASDYLLYLTIASQLTFLANKNTRNDFGKISLMYLETIMSSLALPLYAKAIILRSRPYVYNPDTPDNFKFAPDARRSFFSGHASTSFASAVFLSTVYNDYFPDSGFKPYVWGISLLTAISVSYLRYESGMHFPTDILTGAVIGSALGYLIPYLHKTDKTNEVPKDFAPTVYGIEFNIPFQIK